MRGVCMGKGMDWQRVEKDRRMRTQGSAPHEDLLPRGPWSAPTKKASLGTISVNTGKANPPAPGQAPSSQRPRGAAGAGLGVTTASIWPEAALREFRRATAKLEPSPVIGTPATPDEMNLLRSYLAKILGFATPAEVADIQRRLAEGKARIRAAKTAQKRAEAAERKRAKREAKAKAKLATREAIRARRAAGATPAPQVIRLRRRTPLGT